MGQESFAFLKVVTDKACSVRDCHGLFTLRAKGGVPFRYLQPLVRVVAVYLDWIQFSGLSR